MQVHAMHRHAPVVRLLGDRPPAGGRWAGGAPRVLAPRPPGHEFRVALCVPLRGPEGVWGPSCLASARLAQAELNRWSGIAGRACELQVVDASSEAADVGQRLARLAEEGEIDAIVGMCISSVRQRIVGATGGSVPFVYTCLYEGGDHSPGLFAIGETAARQLRPSIAWLAQHRHARRWMLVGNDYVWPRVSHAIARRAIAAGGGEVVGETFLPLGGGDHAQVLEALRTSRADAVLLSMVGQDAIDFNRAFGRLGLQQRMLRLSCAVEENLLLAIGAEYTQDLYVALGYFASLETEANLAFKERYFSRFGQRAPALNSIGQSLYEGLHFLGALCADRAPATPLGHASAREADGAAGSAPIYLAAADGHAFRVLARL